MLSRSSRSLTFALPLLLAAGGAAYAQDGSKIGAPPPEGLQGRIEGATPEEELPRDVKEDVGITPKPGASVPQGTPFMDDEAEKVLLGDYFGEKPVLIQFVYYRCPGLCNVAMRELVRTLEGMRWTPGEQFELVQISINHQEMPYLAKGNKESQIEEYVSKKRYVAVAGAAARRNMGRTGAELAQRRASAMRGWHCLTGGPPEIREVTDALGFGFAWDDENQEYAHSAGLFVCTPSGKLSRVLFGTEFEPETVRLSLVEAGEGKVGSFMDDILLYCYHFDPDTGLYTAQVMNVMRLAGVTTVLLLAGMVLTFLRRERLRRTATLDLGESESSSGQDKLSTIPALAGATPNPRTDGSAE